MDGNPFGHSITFQEGSSIKLLDYNEDQQIVLREDALNILRRLPEPVAVISLVGSYRRGKSWLANVLHGRHDGFTLGHGTAGETRGIYMWDSPFIYKGKRILVLDSEGLDDPERDAGFATKLFVLCLAISSSFIYNINGVVGKEDVEKLFSMTDLSRFVNPNDTSEVMPHLIVLLRDFILERPDDLCEYFLDQLRSVNVPAANNLGDKFSEFSVYGLPHPGLSSHQLRELHEIDTFEFDKEFIEEVTNAVNKILNTVQPKYIDSNPVNGEVLATFLECCVQTLNARDNQFDLSLSNNYDSIVQYAAKKAATEAFDWYRSMMVAELNENVLPVPWIVFNNIQEESLQNAENCFNNSLVGNGTHLLKAYQEFRRNVDTFSTKIRGQNSESLYSCNRDTAGLLWDQLVTSQLTADNLFISVEMLEQAIERFQEQYLDARLDCPEASRVLDEFKSIYYNAARRLFNDLKSFREVVEVEKLLTIEAQKDRATAQAELPKIAGRMEGFDDISRKQKEEADRYRQQAEEMGRRVTDLEQQMQRREAEYQAMINNLQNELRNR